jgi:hypothetical protein
MMRRWVQGGEMAMRRRNGYEEVKWLPGGEMGEMVTRR